MHKSLSGDNTPIGWIEMYLGLYTMFQKMPITVLSARPKQSVVFEERAKHATDEKLIHSVELGSPI
jgi:hypothetical protein